MNHVKSFSLFTALLVLTAMFPAISQPGTMQGQGQFQEKYREFEARRIAFITRELSLTPDEAQVFWPVYNQYNKKRNQMMINHRQQRVNIADLDNLSENELKELAYAEIHNMEEMLALRKEYHARFLEILSPKKVLLLYNAEREFNRTLYREGRGGRQGRGRN